MHILGIHIRLFVGTAILITGLSIFPSSVEARGFRIFDQGAVGTAQSAAFTAQADDPSAIYYNPSGMSEFEGFQLQLGTNLVGGGVTYENDAGMMVEGGPPGSVAWPPPSQFYTTLSLNSWVNALNPSWLESATMGVGVISPFGNNIEYPEDSPFSSAVVFASLPLIDIKPTIAFKFNDYISLGIGADIYTFSGLFGEGQFEFQFTQPTPFGPANVEITGTDTKAGWNASFMFTPLRNENKEPRVNLGFVYRSRVDLDLEGDFLINGTKVADAKSTLVLPQSVTTGLAYWPVQTKVHKWKLEADFDYTWWDAFSDFDVMLSTGQTIPSPQNWENDYTIMVGTEYKYRKFMHENDENEIWHAAFRAGYWYSTTPVPDETFSPAIPDSNENAVSVGGGFWCNRNKQVTGFLKFCAWEKWPWKSIGLDVAYQALIIEPRTITNNQNPTVNGRYTNDVHTGALSLTAKF